MDMSSSDSEIEKENLLPVGNFQIDLPAELLSDCFNDLTASDEELLLNMDSEEIETYAEATASSVANLLNDMPDLTQAAIEELPNVEAPVVPSHVNVKRENPAGRQFTEPQPTKRFKSTTEEEVEQLFQSRQAPSTKSNTKWAVKMFQEWNVEVNGNEMDMTTVTPEQLATSLSKFYVETRPKVTTNNPTDLVYHRNSLKSIRSGINRFLADLHRNIDIARDREFKTANGVLDGLLKQRTRSGQSKPTKHKEIIEKDDLNKISSYLSAAPTCPIVLCHHVWYNLTIHFVTRGMEFHHQLKTNSFSFENDESGEYVTLNLETQQKNHQGGLNTDTAPCDKRMYATGTPSCPVNMLKLMLKKTDKKATNLFNQYRKNAVIAPYSNEIWFTDKPLAKRTFANFLADICKSASVTKPYTPHCLRATAIQFLNDEGFEARHIMFMSSHKSESSLRSYNRTVSTSQKRLLSASLSAITHPNREQTVCRSPSKHASGNNENTDSESALVVANERSGLPLTQNTNINLQTNLATPNFFTNASFSGCTFNFSK